MFLWIVVVAIAFSLIQCGGLKKNTLHPTKEIGQDVRHHQILRNDKGEIDQDAFSIPLSQFFSLGVSKNTEEFVSVDNSELDKLPDTAKELGQLVFFSSCYVCHKGSVNMLAPGLPVLRTMMPRDIFASLNGGKMKQQASNLTASERKAVSEWLTGSKLKSADFWCKIITLRDNADRMY